MVTKPMRSKSQAVRPHRPSLRPLLVAIAAACIWAIPQGAFTSPSSQSVSRGLRGQRSEVTQLAAAKGKISSDPRLAEDDSEDSVASRAFIEEAPVEEPKGPFDPRKEPGVTLPLMYFDPAGFAKVGDRETFYKYRASELKHGRIGMIAALGAVVQHWFRFPGFQDVPNGVQAVLTAPGTYGFIAILLIAGAVDAVVWVQDPEKEPGDFGDPAGIGQYYKEWRNRELNNCRMGMLSITGIVAAELAGQGDSVNQVWRPLGNLEVE